MPTNQDFTSKVKKSLGHEVYRFLFDNVPAFCQHLVVSVINDALLRSVMPVNWKLTKLILLLKKG